MEFIPDYAHKIIFPAKIGRSTKVAIDVYFEHNHPAETTSCFVLLSDLKNFILNARHAHLHGKRRFKDMSVKRHLRPNLIDYINTVCSDDRLGRLRVQTKRLFIDVFDMEKVVTEIGSMRGLKFDEGFIQDLWFTEYGLELVRFDSTIVIPSSPSSPANLPPRRRIPRIVLRMSSNNTNEDEEERALRRNKTLTTLTVGQLEDLVVTAVETGCGNGAYREAIEDYKKTREVAKEAIQELIQRYDNKVIKLHKETRAPLLLDAFTIQQRNEMRTELENTLRPEVEEALSNELKDEVWKKLVDDQRSEARVEAMRLDLQVAKKKEGEIPLHKRPRKAPAGPLYAPEVDLMEELLGLVETK